MIKAIFFDLDDTIIDSGNAIVEHHIKIAKLLGDRKIPSKPEIYSFVGMPWDMVLHKLWPKNDNDKFKETYLSIPKENKLFPISGVEKTLAVLKVKYILGLITGRHRESTLNYLDKFNLSKDFSCIVTGTDKITKPNPEVFEFALEQLNGKNNKKINIITNNITKKEILFVGDSMIDANCARQANVKFIAVETGFYKKNDFYIEGFDTVLKNVNELPEYLNNFVSKNI